MVINKLITKKKSLGRKPIKMNHKLINKPVTSQAKTYGKKNNYFGELMI